MSIQLKEVSNRNDLKKFIYLPAAIHRNHEHWLPPIYRSEWKFFNPAKNRAFAYCDAIRVLALDGQKPVGRILGIINKRYNDLHNEKTTSNCGIDGCDAMPGCNGRCLFFRRL